MGVLLLGADYYGTLAAARAFGKTGVRVTMADSNRQARGLYSRYVAERLVHPSRPDDVGSWAVERAPLEWSRGARQAAEIAASSSSKGRRTARGRFVAIDFMIMPLSR